jgi:hypothetical protein
VIAGEVPDAHPGGDPCARSEHVEEGEGARAHLGDARDDPVRFAQADDEPGADHHDPAVAGDDRLGPVQVLGLEQDVLAIAQDQLTARVPADQVTDLGPDDRGGDRDDPDQDDIQPGPAGTGEDGTGDQRELARDDRNADVLQQQQQGDGQVAVMVEGTLQGVEETGQRRGP